MKCVCLMADGCRHSRCGHTLRDRQDHDVRDLTEVEAPPVRTVLGLCLEQIAGRKNSRRLNGRP